MALVVKVRLLPFPLLEIFALWPKGRAADFDSASLGSIPSGAVLEKWKVAERGFQSVLKTDMPGESLWVRLLCLPCRKSGELAER